MKQKFQLPKAFDLVTEARQYWPDDKDIVKQTKISRTTIWRIEKGKANVYGKTLARLILAVSRQRDRQRHTGEFYD